MQGITFRGQLADGFPDMSDSTTHGPDVSVIELIGPGRIVEANNTGQNSVEERSQTWRQRKTTFAGTAKADGLLARLTFDTTGFNSIGQQWGLVPANSFLDDTDVILAGADVSNGTVSIAVSDLSSLTLAALDAVIIVVLGACRNWGQRAQSISQMPHLALPPTSLYAPTGFMLNHVDWQESSGLCLRGNQRNRSCCIRFRCVGWRTIS